MQSVGTSERVLLLLDRASEAQLPMRTLQEHGIDLHRCSSAGELREELARGAAAALLSSTMLQQAGSAGVLREALDQQPGPSPVPLLVLLAADGDARQVWQQLADMASIDQVAVLQEPVDPDVLLAAAQVALRARRRRLQQGADERAHAVRLAETDRQRDDFLGLLGHELRSPLAAIYSGIQLLQMPQATEQTRHKTRSLMKDQVQQMVRLVNDLLEVSRISRGKLRITKRPLQLAELVSAAVATVRPQIEHRQHELSVELPAAPVELQGDPARLQQVLAHVLDNAVKFTPDKGHIAVTAEASTDRVMIRVRDTGCGISAADVASIFDALERRAGQRKRGGLGLGLTLARGIVELHGGRIEAHSSAGQGAEICISLPRS